MSGNPDVEQIKSSLVVKMDQDSAIELQALFDSVLKPNSKRPLQVPLRMRKLPDSFFNPPSTGSKSPSVSSISHSRENSADSAVFGTAPSGNPTTTTSGLQVNHPRAHSSPASLQQTYQAGQAAAASHPSPQHVKQRSYDIAPAGSALDELGPLPPGWEQARTCSGQIYFLNHITQTTTWEDPRKSAAVQAQLSSGGVVSPSTSPQPQGASKSPAASTASLGPLPEGWEQATTAEGEIYFINHQTKTTSWFDPRIPAHLQRVPGGLGPQSLSWLQPISQINEQATQQKLRLQSLQLERERLKLRQQEIMRQQELMLRSGGGTGAAEAVTTGMDPFLSGLTEHTRQESADSGLGLGNNYSLPHTPDDFLSTIDDNMDAVSGDMASLDSHEMTSLSDNIDSTDELVPSLLDEEFTGDILLDELINPNSKGGNSLTWL